jgi:hypothetical protein
MAATQTAPRGLSTDELARICDTLAAGRKFKVMFTEAAGQLGGVYTTAPHSPKTTDH